MGGVQGGDVPVPCSAQGCGGRMKSESEENGMEVEHAERLHCFACLTDLAPDTSSAKEDETAPEVCHTRRHHLPAGKVWANTEPQLLPACR